jgi:hypothetical protein
MFANSTGLRALELAVLDREHHEVEPQLPGQLGVELIKTRAVRKRHYRSVERQVLVDDLPAAV